MEHEPPTRQRIESTSGLFSTTLVYELTGTSGETSVRFSVTGHPTGALRLMQPLIARTTQRNLDTGFGRLKEVLVAGEGRIGTEMMSSDTPIACSLNAEELPRRLAEIRAIGADSLLGVDDAGALRFRNDGATRARLEAIVAAESECCSFLAFDLRTSGEALELSITAPRGAEAVADELVAAFQS